MLPDREAAARLVRANVGFFDQRSKRPKADYPVATLLAVINLVDDNMVLLLAVGRDLERREPGFAAVLGTGEEVEDLLFLGDDTRLLLATVGDAFLVKLMATCRISSVMPFLLSDFFFLRPFHIENTEQTILWIVSRLRAAFAYLRFTLS